MVRRKTRRRENNKYNRARRGQTAMTITVGVYIVMVCPWTGHILGKNSAS